MKKIIIVVIILVVVIAIVAGAYFYSKKQKEDKNKKTSADNSNPFPQATKAPGLKDSFKEFLKTAKGATEGDTGTGRINPGKTSDLPAGPNNMG